MKISLYSHHISLLGCQKVQFVILFSHILFGLIVLLYCLKMQLFLFKNKEIFFLKRFLWKPISKFHLEPLGSKIIFLKNMQPCFIGLHLSFVYYKIMIWIQVCGSTMLGMHRLDLYISIEHLVRPLHELIFLKLPIASLFNLLCLWIKILISLT